MLPFEMHAKIHDNVCYFFYFIQKITYRFHKPIDHRWEYPDHLQDRLWLPSCCHRHGNLLKKLLLFNYYLLDSNSPEQINSGQQVL